MAEDLKPVEIPSVVTLKEFADAIGVPSGDIQRKLMSLGVIAALNQKLNEQVTTRLGKTFGFSVTIAQPVRRRCRCKRSKWRSREWGCSRERHGRCRHCRRSAQGARERLRRTCPPASGRHHHGPCRPRQNHPPRRHPQRQSRGFRVRWHHPAHRRVPGGNSRPVQCRPAAQNHVFRHARPRSLHRHARPWRSGHRHRRDRGLRRRRRHAPDHRSHPAR